MKIEVIESRKANDETVDGLLRDGAADVVIIDDYDTPDEEGAAARRWCHVIANRNSEQHVSEYLRLCAERVQPTPGGFTRFYITTDAHSAKRLLSFRINARVFVDHLEEGEEPDISMESKVRDALDRRKRHTTGIVRTWVAGQVGRAIWVQDDQTARLVPYFLSELHLVKNCICAAMDSKPGIEYPQGWECPYHGFVRKGTAHTGVCAQQERDGRLIQVAVAD